MIASDPNNVVMVDRFDQLSLYKQHLLLKLCKLDNPAPLPTPHPYNCKSDVILDIAFLIDSSGSIEDSGKGNYDVVKRFIIDLIQHLDVGPNSNQVFFLLIKEKI